MIMEKLQQAISLLTGVITYEQADRILRRSARTARLAAEALAWGLPPGPRPKLLQHARTKIKT